MAEAETHSDQSAPKARGMWPSKWRWRISLVLLGLIVLGFAGAWLSREQIAGDLIDDAIAESGLEASYEIESIGTHRQVLRDLVIGDPNAPDVTAERVVVEIVYLFGSAQVGQIQIVKPRLFGSFRDGSLSLGSLDPLLFAESDEPAGLPEYDVKIIDGRAQIDSDYGLIGIKIDGEGPIDDGFAGKVAVTAPGAGFDGCSAQTATLYGDISSDGGEPRFEGPLRLRNVDCNGAQVRAADVTAALTLSDDFSSLNGAFDISSDELAYGDFSSAGLTGNSDLTWGFAGAGGGSGNLTLRHDLQSAGMAGPMVRLGTLSADGILRARNGFEEINWDVDVAGEDAALDLGEGGALTDLRTAASGTLFEALLGKFEAGLSQSMNGGRLAGDVNLRIDDGVTNVIVPEARLRSASGETVLALSRVSYSSRGERLSGNILTGGTDLPRINGRMEQGAAGYLAMRLTMAEYREGGDAFTIPRLEVRQDRRGRVSFDGQIQADGAIPDGAIRSLELPIEGTWSSDAGLAIGRRCAEVRLAGLTYSELTLQERRMSLCPSGGGAMVSYRDALNVNIATEDLELVGALSESPAVIQAARAVIRYPGSFEIEGLTAQIGADDNSVRLSLKSLEGEIGDEIGGSFSGGTAAMDVVPLDLAGLGGAWSYEDSTLRIADTAFFLTERTGEGFAPEARFEPLLAQGASLILAEGRVQADADLLNPASGMLVTSVAIAHDLSSGQGQADIAVPGITFGDNFQPDDLSALTKGVIALAEGTVRGEGLITWTGDDIDSSGAFRTDDFDFAAAFGPVRGVSGEIVFTDLVALTTAPSQVIEIASVNPGVEVLGGRIVYSMTGGEVIAVEDGRWPFMGGELILRPTTLIYGGKGGQRYTFEVVGLDAAVFVAQMELTNLGATGIFDGTIPIYFDAIGNGSINGGLLISRAPGGNVAYVGELTYEDMGAMANYAFQTLRSLDYRQMSIELNGDLAGEILTNFNIDGVRQGDGTSQNFVTRELAKLPIRFKINVRSDNFYLLATIVRGLFDPTVFGNPIDQGLLQIQGGQFVPRGSIEPPPNPEPAPQNTQETDDVQRRDEPAVQPPESDDLP